MEKRLKKAKNIVKQFLEVFLKTGVNYSNFYRNDSILTFESEVFIGTQNKVSTLNFNSNFTN